MDKKIVTKDENEQEPYETPMEESLCKIFASFKIASNLIHVLHTSMIWDDFLKYHPFLDELYNFLEDQIDEIMEMLEQNGWTVPVSLEELLEESEVQELEWPITDITDQMKEVSGILGILEKVLQDGIIEAWKEEMMVEQNNLIDYQKFIKKMERKNRRSLWIK